MKKKFKIKGFSILMAILMAATIIPIGAILSLALTSGDYEYSVLSETNKTAEITKYNGTAGDVTIPSTIDGYKVTSIGDSAFFECAYLTTVKIGNSVTHIGDSAFCRTGLKGVTIPDSVTSIGASAFLYTPFYDSLPDGEVYLGKVLYEYKGTMPKSTEIIIKPGTVSISYNAFQHCTGLTNVTIPDSVTSICSAAFWNCTGLTNIILPDSIKSIGWSAFYGCTGLKDVTIPDSVTSICSAAFWNCTGLTNIKIPESVTSIGDSAFYGCTSLKDVTIPSNVTSIDYRVFRDCTGLTNIIIPSNVTSIGSSAFHGCTSLTNVIIPDGVTSISGNAFSDTPFFASQPDGEVYFGKVLYAYKGTMPKDTEINIKAGTISITDGAFKGCTGLTSVIIPDSVTYIGSGAFDNTPFYNSLPDGEVYLGKVFYKYNGTMPADTEIDVKDGTVSIADSAFRGCKGLKSVIIPNSVTDIGNYAFMDCTDLKSVTIPSSVKIIGDIAFGYYYNNGGYEILPGFTITGIKGSAAEIYAIERRINFRLPLSLGDVNGDGKVTAADAILALRAEAKLITLSQEELWAADVTGDSEVTAADAIKILRFEAKLITAF